MSLVTINKSFSKIGVLQLYCKKHDFTFPVSEYHLKNLLYKLSLKNTLLLVIENMSLAVLLTNHEANKLPFIHTILNTKIPTNIRCWNKSKHTFVKNKSVHTGCQMINIDSQWDTSLWDYFKLTKLSTWINILDSDISDYHKYNHHIIGFPIEEVDLFFAKAMGFEFLDNV